MEKPKMSTSMDAILSDEPIEHATHEAPESDSPGGEGVSADADTGAGEMPEPKPAKVSAKPSAEADGDDDEELPKDVVGLRKALTAARGDGRKYKKQWQEVQREFARLEGRLAAYEQQKTRQPPEQATPAPKPEEVETDFYGNPIGHLDKRERALLEKLQAEQFKQRADFDEAFVSETHEDYAEAKAAFAEAAQKAPWLWQQVASSARPALAVYREGKKLLGGGQNDETAKLRAEIDQLKAQLAGGSNSNAPAAASRPTIPKSIAGARGTSVGAAKPWVGPKSLDEILA